MFFNWTVRDRASVPLRQEVSAQLQLHCPALYCAKLSVLCRNVLTSWQSACKTSSDSWENPRKCRYVVRVISTFKIFVWTSEIQLLTYLRRKMWIWWKEIFRRRSCASSWPNFWSWEPERPLMVEWDGEPSLVSHSKSNKSKSEQNPSNLQEMSANDTDD